MIAADELHNLVAMRVAARQTQRTHGSLGARVHHADDLDVRVDLVHFFRELGLDDGRSSIACAALYSFFERLYDLRMSMPDDERSPGAHIIDILVAIDIEYAVAEAVVDERRRAVDIGIGPDRAVDAARHVLLRFRKGGGRFRLIQHVCSSLSP